MPLILASNSASGGYEVDNSLRFNYLTSDSLTKTFASSGNRRTWTFSCWFKRSNITNNIIQGLLEGGITNSTSVDISGVRIEADNTVKVLDYVSGFTTNVTTSQLFRDISAWYNIVVAYDTTQATSTDRIKIWINGSQVSALSTTTYPSLNYQGFINGSGIQVLGACVFSGLIEFFDGYMSEVYLIDGQALDPTSFGQTDPSVSSSGIWIPKAYSGSYGTNGYYLKFANSAALGTDSSGNGNNWTVNNLTSVDQSTDTPTNNFNTWNSLNKHASSTASDGNLTYTTSGTSQFEPAQCTIGFSAGKWYCEHKVNSIGATGFLLGIFKTSVSGMVQSEMDTARFAYNLVNGDIAKNASNIQTGLATFTTNDILGIAVDITNGTLIFYKNGSQVGTTITDSDITNNEWTFGVQPRLCGFSSNFGNPPFTISSGNTDGAGFGNFEYAVPSGYYALCTKNLADYG